MAPENETFIDIKAIGKKAAGLAKQAKESRESIYARHKREILEDEGLALSNVFRDTLKRFSFFTDDKRFVTRDKKAFEEALVVIDRQLKDYTKLIEKSINDPKNTEYKVNVGTPKQPEFISVDQAQVQLQIANMVKQSLTSFSRQPKFPGFNSQEQLGKFYDDIYKSIPSEPQLYESAVGVIGKFEAVEKELSAAVKLLTKEKYVDQNLIDQIAESERKIKDLQERLEVVSEPPKKSTAKPAPAAPEETAEQRVEAEKKKTKRVTSKGPVEPEERAEKIRLVTEKIAKDMLSDTFVPALKTISTASELFSANVEYAATKFAHSASIATEDMILTVAESVRKNVTLKFRKYGSDIETALKGIMAGLDNLGAKINEFQVQVTGATERAPDDRTNAIVSKLGSIETILKGIEEKSLAAPITAAPVVEETKSAVSPQSTVSRFTEGVRTSLLTRLMGDETKRFESGGPIHQTGPAIVHAGEFVLPKKMVDTIGHPYDYFSQLSEIIDKKQIGHHTDVAKISASLHNMLSGAYDLPNKDPLIAASLFHDIHKRASNEPYHSKVSSAYISKHPHIFSVAGVDPAVVASLSKHHSQSRELLTPVGYTDEQYTQIYSLLPLLKISDALSKAEKIRDTPFRLGEGGLSFIRENVSGLPKQKRRKIEKNVAILNKGVLPLFRRRLASGTGYDKLKSRKRRFDIADYLSDAAVAPILQKPSRTDDDLLSLASFEILEKTLNQKGSTYYTQGEGPAGIIGGIHSSIEYYDPSKEPYLKGVKFKNPRLAPEHPAKFYVNFLSALKRGQGIGGKLLAYDLVDMLHREEGKSITHMELSASPDLSTVQSYLKMGFVPLETRSGLGTIRMGADINQFMTSPKFPKKMFDPALVKERYSPDLSKVTATMNDMYVYLHPADEATWIPKKTKISDLLHLAGGTLPKIAITWGGKRLKMPGIFDVINTLGKGYQRLTGKTGPADLFKDPFAQLSRVVAMNKIRNADVESAYMWTPESPYVPLVSTRGTPTSVKLEDEQVRNMTKWMGDFVLLHNHPKYREGSPLHGYNVPLHSIPDVMSAYLAGPARRSVVVSGKHFSSITNPGPQSVGRYSANLGPQLDELVHAKRENERAKLVIKWGDKRYGITFQKSPSKVVGSFLKEASHNLGEILKNDMLFTGSLFSPSAIGKFAVGGPLRLGQSAIVGEEGPEMIVPSKRSMGFEVIPNHLVPPRYLAKGTKTPYTEDLIDAVNDIINKRGSPRKSWRPSQKEVAIDTLGVSTVKTETALNKLGFGAKKLFTNMLILQHVIRVIAATSAVLAANQNMASRGFGFIVDMLMIGLVPVFKEVMMIFVGIGQAIRPITSMLRMFFVQHPLAAFITAVVGIGVATIGFILYLKMLYNSIKSAVVALDAFAESLTPKEPPEPPKSPREKVRDWFTGSERINKIREKLPAPQWLTSLSEKIRPKPVDTEFITEIKGAVTEGTLAGLKNIGEFIGPKEKGGSGIHTTVGRISEEMASGPAPAEKSPGFLQRIKASRAEGRFQRALKQYNKKHPIPEYREHNDEEEEYELESPSWLGKKSKGGYIPMEGLAYLHAGEVVLPKSVVDKVPKYAEGGVVGSSMGNIFSNITGMITGGDVIGTVGAGMSTFLKEGGAEMIGTFGAIAKTIGAVLAPIAAFSAVGGTLIAITRKGFQASILTTDAVGKALRIPLVGSMLQLGLIALAAIGIWDLLKSDKPQPWGFGIVPAFLEWLKGINIKDILGKVWEEIVKSARSAWDWIKNRLPDKVRGVMERAWDWIKLKFGKVIDLIPDRIKEAFKNIKDKIVEGLRRLFSKGQQNEPVKPTVKGAFKSGLFLGGLLVGIDEILFKGTPIMEALPTILSGAIVAGIAGGLMVLTRGFLGPLFAVLGRDWMAGFGSRAGDYIAKSLGFEDTKRWSDIGTIIATTFNDVSGWAAGGAAVGTMVAPGAGTAIGAVGGGIIGLLAGLTTDLFKISSEVNSIGSGKYLTGQYGLLGSVTAGAYNVGVDARPLYDQFCKEVTAAGRVVVSAFETIGNMLVSAGKAVINTFEWISNALKTIGSTIQSFSPMNIGVNVAKTLAGVPFMQAGGTVVSEGIAYLHAGEVVSPMQVRPISNPTTTTNTTTSEKKVEITNHNQFIVQRESDRALYERFKQMMIQDQRKFVI